MPTLDVIDVILSPEFLTKFLVQSAKRVIGDNGVETDTLAAPVQAYGVVTPAKDTFQRTADGSRIETNIEIITRYPLTDGSKTDDINSTQADVVIWRNRQYVVSAVADWSQFGRGFYKVAADLQAINPPAAS
jgi:hypothetical protein